MIRIALFLVLGFSLKTDPQIREWKKSKKPFILLCAHPSELDAAILLAASFPRYTRFVAGAQQIYKGFQGRLLRMLDVIPKKQFTSDIRAVRDMIKTVSSGYNLGMMPEGRVSMDGTENPIDISTAKLIKNLCVPVAAVYPHGSYFVKPPYNYKGLKKGRVSGKVRPLLCPDEIKKLSAEEILTILEKSCKYNEFEELRGSGKTYGSKKKPFMEGVENLLYVCPKCRRKNTIKRNGNRIECEVCGAGAELTREMFFTPDISDIPDNIAEWNKLQLDFERTLASANELHPEFRVYKSVLRLGTTEDYEDRCWGVLSLCESFFSYEDEEEKLCIPLELLPGVSADYMLGHIALYQDDLIRRFRFENKQNAAELINSLMIFKKYK